jgi:ceramide glucosyltransferase
MAWTVGVWGVRDDVLRRKFWLVPFRDLLNFGVWLASFASNRITWGGEKYELRKGRMIPLSAASGETRSAAPAPR